MYRSPTSIGNKLALTLCVLVAICFASFARANIQTGNPQTCPCPGIRGPVNTCPNVPQTLIVTDPPVGSVITFSVAADVPGNTGHIVSQSGAIATIDQPGTYIANVCFPLNLNVPQGPNCGGNPCSPVIVASLTSSIAGNPSQVTICQTGPASIVLTCSANVAVDAATTTYRFFLNNVLFRDNASPALTVDLNTFSGSLGAFTCQVVTQSTQCVSSTSNVINVVKCSGGSGNCPSTVTLSSLDNCPFRLQATINNPQVNTIYTFTLRRQDTMGRETVLGIQVVGPFGTIPSGGVFAIFSNLPAGAASFVVDVNIPNCPTLTSNRVSLPDCGSVCQPVGATLSANQPGNLLTICNTGSDPSTILLTCSASSSVSGATFRFSRNGVVVADSASNTLLVSFSDFASITLAQFSCQVITQSGSCVGTQSNVITIQRCSGGGNCPVTPSVTLIAVGSGCPFKLQATINNPQINTVYTITLFSQTTMNGPRVAVATQTVGPFTTIPAGGVSVIFSGLPTTAAWYEVDVSVQGCPIVTSNMVDLPDCGCQNVGATLSSDQPGNPSSLTICTTPPGPSTIVLTCAATSSVTGAVFRFVQNGVTVQESASNTLTLSISQFTSISLANIFCQVITQSGQCVGTQSNIIIVQRCSGGGNCPVTPSVTLVAVGSGCPFKLQAIINNPQINTVYTITLFVQTTMNGPRVAVATQTVGPFTTIPAGGVSVTFSNLPTSGGWFEVDVSVQGCPIVTSNMVDLPDCGCQNVGTTLSSDQPGNPSSLTICTTPPGPSTIVLTCAAASSVTGAVFRFVQNGVTVQESASNTLTLSISQFTSISLANIFCQVITQSGQCVGTQSNIIIVQRCSGGGNCPVTPSVTLVAVGSGCPFQLQATINNPQINTVYTITLFSQTTMNGPRVAVATQTVGPFTTIPAGGVSVIFSGLPTAEAWFEVDVSVQGCPVVTSNMVDLPACPSGNCPTPTLTVKSGDLCSGTLKLLSSISGCTNGVTYVFTLQSSTVVGGPFTNTGQSISVVCSNGAASAIFSGISQAAFYRVQLSSTVCTTTFSDVLNVPQQTTLPLGSTLIISVDQPICQATNRVATLTCNINPANAIVGTVTYQFFVQGSTTPIAPTSGNTLVLNLNSQGNLNYFCTASVGNSCIITSNIVLVNVCSAGGNCPTPIIQRGSGDICSGTLQIGALINNCVPGTSYTFTLQRAAATTGPFTDLASPAPISVVCSGTSQAVATFTGIATAGFYRVSVSSAACVTTFSDVLNIPQQTQLPTGSSLTLTVDQDICVATGKSATLTCTVSPSSAIVGTITYQFFVVGSTTPIAPTSGNQLVLNMNNQGDQSYFCVASVDSNCVIRSNNVLVGVCNNCPSTQPVLSASRLSVCFPFSCTKLICKANVPNGSRLVIRQVPTAGAAGVELASGLDVIFRIVCPHQTKSFVCVLETPGCPDISSNVVVIEVSRLVNPLCGGNKVNICQKIRQSFLKICLPFDKALLLGALGDNRIMDGNCPDTFTHPTGACSLAALAEVFIKKEIHPRISEKSDPNSFFDESEWNKEQ